MPRVTVRIKIYTALAVIIILGVLSMLYIYRGVDAVTTSLKRLDEVEVPFSTAAYEMEVNSEEYSLEIMKYLLNPNQKHRAAAEDDRRDFSRYHARYVRLSKSKEENELGKEIGIRHQQLIAMGGTLKKLRDDQELLFLQVTNLLEKIDDIADDGMPVAASRAEPARSRALAAIADIEGEAGEIGFWLTTYLHRPTPLARQRVKEKLAEFRSALASYRSLSLSPEERRMAAVVERTYTSVAATADDILVAEDGVNALLARFLAHQDGIDDLLDDQIQVLALKNMAAPRQEADDAAERVLENLRYLIAFYAFAAVVCGTLLIMMVAKPLNRLARGTNAIRLGDLGHRIEERGGDEFEDLSRQFNAMAAQLQETTVSKSELEASDHELRRTVADLEREIAERERAEREQEKLRGELRRIEAMAAMGVLTAGVAHEVRNPLFGISSTLDAMEAQPEVNGEGKRYRTVLRREVDRLNKLMHDLLEFGRPASDNHTKGKLNKVIADAIRICAPLAKAEDVAVINNVADAVLLQMHRSRLTQVFVNLIENAVQHAPAGTEVTISVMTTADDSGRSWIECTVEDSGAGFSPGDLPLIFDPFFTRRRDGTGLGLSIVQRVVDEHQGQIVAGNRPEGGAVMTVRLPIEKLPT